MTPCCLRLGCLATQLLQPLPQPVGRLQNVQALQPGRLPQAAEHASAVVTLGAEGCAPVYAKLPAASTSTSPSMLAGTVLASTVHWGLAEPAVTPSGPVPGV